MARLIATSAINGALPIDASGLRLVDKGAQIITSIAPFSRKKAGVQKALKEGVGLGFPEVGKALFKGKKQIIWSGQGQAMLIGATPPELSDLAAITDQSDGWSLFELSGDLSEDVLARLVPIDLKMSVFGVGDCLRSILGHMPVSICRLSKNSFQIMVFRSMSQTCIHELDTAMRGVVARQL